MKKIVAAIMGIVMFAIPVLVYAADDYYRSEIDTTGDGYITFGDAEHPRDEEYGIRIWVNEESIAAQWVNIDVEILNTDQHIIFERDIDKFLILANGKIIDFFYPSWERDSEGRLVPLGYYTVKPSIPELIGTDVQFQIVGIQDNNVAQYAVAWSNITDTIRMDPLPVKDEEAINVLYMILHKLGEILNRLTSMENKLTALLEKISRQLETMLTPSPEASARLEKAAQDLFNATPMAEMQQQNDFLKNTFTDSINRLEQPYSRLTIGEKRDWLGIGMEFYLIDLTELQDQVKLMRNFLEAVIWIEFFMFLLFYLAPKLDI
jgi:hypothetical protein